MTKHGYTKAQLLDKMQRYYTTGLFIEFSTDATEPLFTLSERDKVRGEKKYLSLKQIYLSYSDDPTEYQFAIDVFGSYRHWQALCKTTRLKPYIKEWREELEVKIRSQALRDIAASSATSVGAARYLADKGWGKVEGKTKGKKGRAEMEDAIVDSVADDMARLGLKLVK